jgi:chaperonin GroES
LIPEKAQEALNEGVVLAVGPGAVNAEGTRLAMALQEGDKVVLPAYGGNTVKLNGEELLLFRCVSFCRFWRQP